MVTQSSPSSLSSAVVAQQQMVLKVKDLLASASLVPPQKQAAHLPTYCDRPNTNSPTNWNTFNEFVGRRIFLILFSRVSLGEKMAD